MVCYWLRPHSSGLDLLWLMIVSKHTGNSRKLVEDQHLELTFMCCFRNSHTMAWMLTRTVTADGRGALGALGPAPGGGKLAALRVMESSAPGDVHKAHHIRTNLELRWAGRSFPSFLMKWCWYLTFLMNTFYSFVYSLPQWQGTLFIPLAATAFIWFM